MQENKTQQMPQIQNNMNEEMHKHMEQMHQGMQNNEEQHMMGHDGMQGQEDMHEEHNRFQLNVPYPEIKISEKIIQYARLLQDDYAGVISELTAINQYSYHHFITDDVDKETADTFAGIAVVEMHHLELLAQAIIKLGGDPLFRGSYSNGGQFWNGSYVKYAKGTRQILLEAIKSEQEAIAQYKKHISMIRDSGIRQLLERIILDEQYHITIINNLLNKVS